jgi:hypothetical protein
VVVLVVARPVDRWRHCGSHCSGAVWRFRKIHPAAPRPLTEALLAGPSAGKMRSGEGITWRHPSGPHVYVRAEVV